MAAFPCLRCGQRFPGPAENIYASRYDGDQRESYRHVVCPSCAVELLESFRMGALYRDADGDWTYPEDPTIPQMRLFDDVRAQKRPGR